MFNQWEELQQFYDSLNNQLASQDLDSRLRAKIQKRASLISEVLGYHAQKEDVQATIADTQEQLQQTTDEEMKAMFEEELTDLQNQLEVSENSLNELLYPSDPLGDRSAYIEVRAGAGGQEAALFAADLLKMYMQYGIKRGWKASITSESSTDLGGFKEVVVHIVGKNVYGALKNESGVHRVQRVPDTETSGRVHTSTATVAVMPEAEEVDVEINNADLRIDVFRASGAGGQHVNTTDSAVRITHIPTGVVVSCQDERSQHKNKAKAMKVLRARILAHAQEVAKSKESANRKSQVGSGDRSEKIRTYNYPQNRVTDHQVNLTLKKLDVVMLGELDEIVQALQARDRQNQQSDSSILDPIS